MMTATAPHRTPVAEAIRTRRSIRHYRPDPIPPEQLEELLDLTLEAPSSWNYQARSVVVVSDAEGRRGLTEATGGQPHPQEAPVVLVFVAETEAWREDLSDIYEQARRNTAWNEEFIKVFSEAGQDFQRDLEARGLLREYAVKDAMIAASFCMVAASGMGLATSPMNGWDESAVKKVIGIDGRDDLAIALLLPVGLPAETRLHPGRRPRERNVFPQRYGAPGFGSRAPGQPRTPIDSAGNPRQEQAGTP
ncbi:nitroreductase family protein [Streptomyces sp. TRM 70351]|uniref:nitroreductase family protein n=1 Tax=Streptomyces sp. TRM 70351 TaxID=3116552 RepID=UPI002E7C344F|nr:nitroreductase family protein [Streptomyces sp. TRM 70351]MEE1931503.1 nitroreductase family protein [Streptomyces sp. TRM 70351]